jgi:Lar family restriction alleviation protein
MEKHIKLLPCPFCGGQADFFNNEGLISDKFCIQCETCFSGTSVDCETEEDAIKSWNTRAEVKDDS